MIFHNHQKIISSENDPWLKICNTEIKKSRVLFPWNNNNWIHESELSLNKNCKQDLPNNWGNEETETTPAFLRNEN